jgi:hypothetical protein
MDLQTENSLLFWPPITSDGTSPAEHSQMFKARQWVQVQTTKKCDQKLFSLNIVSGNRKFWESVSSSGLQKECKWRSSAVHPNKAG